MVDREVERWKRLPHFVQKHYTYSPERWVGLALVGHS